MKKMKSFRLYVPEAPTTPTRVVSDFTEEEKAAFAEAFKPALEYYRKRERVPRILATGFFVCVLSSFVFPTYISVFVPVGMICVITGLLVPADLPSCPGCQNDLDTTDGPYCPGCGSRSMVLERGQPVITCLPIKHRTRRIGKNASRYCICYCTHCGLHLDEDGL